MNDKPSWRDDFDEEFPGMLSEATDGGGYNARPYLKHFIQSLLDKQREELRELVQGMKQKLYPKDDRSDAQIEHELVMVTTYNQALDDLLTKLEKE